LLKVAYSRPDEQGTGSVSGTRPIDWSCEIRLTVRPANYSSLAICRGLISVGLLISLVITFHANKLLLLIIGLETSETTPSVSRPIAACVEV